MRTISQSIPSFLAFLATSTAIFATPAITGVTAQQRYPWNGKVDVTYTLTEDASVDKEQGLLGILKVSAIDGLTDQTYNASALSGDTALTAGTHSVVWDMAGDGISLVSTAVTFTVSCEMQPALYCVIDLSAGSSASSYSVTYLANAPSGGFNVDAYKMEKLVLRRIEPGSFLMGEQYQTTLTEPYYIGIFEMTQKQYMLVTGDDPSDYKGDKRPVEKVSYVDIRGSVNSAKWPITSAVDATSFVGKIQNRTGLDFDLPTEAQWEFACRAGTTGKYNNDGDSAEDLMLLGRYSDNRLDADDAHTIVGSYRANAWELYDMHGNVNEFCLDWYGPLQDSQIDPTGPTESVSGQSRVRRGGCWHSNADGCSSSYRTWAYSPNYRFADSGFRLARSIAPTSQTVISESSESTTVVSVSMPVITPHGGVVSAWPQSVSMSCATAGATIHYTTDGSVPTGDSPVYSRFRLSERTTVKAIAILNGVSSEIAVAEFAAGQCSDPVIAPADGTEFEHSGQTVSIDWQGEDGTLRYTTDGSDPTAGSPAYTAPITIDETTVVKAKAFGTQFFDSAIVTANLTRVWVNVATPIIAATSSFTGSKTSVTLSCATEGATIRYTLNGNDPNSHATRYTGPFDVTDSCTVKAYAVCVDYLASEIATFAIEKVWGIGDTMGDPDQSFTTGGDLPFVRVDDATAPLGESMKSGSITHNQTSTLFTEVQGPGTISFQWKTSCEKDSEDWYEWDHAEFELDGVAVVKLDGVTTWQTVSREITGDGSHTLLWRYKKDDVESEGEDCCWVADFQWTPVAPPAPIATQTTPEPVPYAWLRGYYPEISDEYEAYEAAALATARNGRPVWECYVAGLDPTDETDDFIATIEMVDGVPQISVGGRGERPGRVYTVEGKENLGDSWGPTNATSRFFHIKARVE